MKKNILITLLLTVMLGGCSMLSAIKPDAGLQIKTNAAIGKNTATANITGVNTSTSGNAKSAKSNQQNVSGASQVNINQNTSWQLFIFATIAFLIMGAIAAIEAFVIGCLFIHYRITKKKG
jgi:hypothetical protein